MCFSATASFITAMGLAPVGVATLAMARRLGPERWQPLALMPLLFATQQALEGFVWLVLDSPGPAPLLPVVSLAYLGFAFALWPIWIPWCALRLATGHLAAWKRLLFRTLWGCGALLAVVLWMPLLFDPNLINPIVRRGSIDYQVTAFWPHFGGHLAVTLIYALIICLPLLLHPFRRLRWLGVAMAVAFGVTQLAFLHAFSSVWCYFSALISMLLIWIIRPASPSGAWP